MKSKVDPKKLMAELKKASWMARTRCSSPQARGRDELGEVLQRVPKVPLLLRL